MDQPRARRMRDRVPRIETGADGTQRWVLGKSKGFVLGSDNRDVLETQGITTTGGLGSFKNPPKNFQEMHPGAYDPIARLRYMDEIGIWAMVMYPNVGGFGAQEFLKLDDPELMLTCVRYTTIGRPSGHRRIHAACCQSPRFLAGMWPPRRKRCADAPQRGIAEYSSPANPNPLVSRC